MIDKREKQVRLWFDMWLQGKDMGILNLFSEDVHYIESWGPQYRGAAKLKHWFEEWNTRGTVLQWDVKQYFHRENQTVVEWYFKCAMKGGETDGFDGLSLIRWTEDDRICFLQEFACNEHRYDPYQDSMEPHFR